MIGTPAKIFTVKDLADYMAAKDPQLSVLERSRALAERVLAVQGDAAEPALVALQHDLTEAATDRRRVLSRS